MGAEKLSINYDLNYILLAIRSQIEDYQFAYFLNKSPFFLLRRMQEDVSCLINKKSIYFSSFYDSNEVLKRESFLIKNHTVYTPEINVTNELFSASQVNNTAFLIPELKEFDYFIKLVGIWKKCEVLDLRKLLNSMKIVESEISIDLNKLRSVNNLIL